MPTHKISIVEQKLRDFALKLLEEKQLDIGDEELKAQLAEDLYERLEERVNAEILAGLPPEKLEEFDKLLASGSNEQLSEFCFKNIPHLQELLNTTLTQFRVRYLGLEAK